MKIISPMATGSGAYIIHRILGNKIPNYHTCGYNPYWTLFPPVLPFLCRRHLNIPNVIHTAPDHAVFFYRKSVPLVITFHGYVLDGQIRPYCSLPTNIYHRTALRFWIKSAVKMAHTVTSVSRFTAHLIQQDLNLSKSLKVIYNGVDVNHFTPVSFPRPARKEVRVLFSGNLTKRKGAHWLPSIAKQLHKNIRIFYTQGLRTRNAFFSNANLQPIGSVPFEHMPDCYRQMDILLMPSVREGFGLAIAEAMACGIPVVATNCSAIPELIDDGKGGFLCPIGDVDAFSEKINLLADSPKTRREMGEYNRAKVEKMFTVDRMVNQYRELFEDVMS